MAEEKKTKKITVRNASAERKPETTTSTTKEPYLKTSTPEPENATVKCQRGKCMPLEAPTDDQVYELVMDEDCPVSVSTSDMTTATETGEDANEYTELKKEEEALRKLEEEEDTRNTNMHMTKTIPLSYGKNQVGTIVIENGEVSYTPGGGEHIITINNALDTLAAIWETFGHLESDLKLESDRRVVRKYLELTRDIVFKYLDKNATERGDEYEREHLHYMMTIARDIAKRAKNRIFEYLEHSAEPSDTVNESIYLFGDILKHIDLYEKNQYFLKNISMAARLIKEENKKDTRTHLSTSELQSKSAHELSDYYKHTLARLNAIENGEKAPEPEPDNDYDFVNHPKHYNNYDVEVIDMMRRIWGHEATAIWCKLTAFKYRMRMGTKPGSSLEEDLEKERFYLEKMKEIAK